jgi:hypothetical protein
MHWKLDCGSFKDEFSHAVKLMYSVVWHGMVVGYVAVFFGHCFTEIHANFLDCGVEGKLDLW